MCRMFSSSKLSPSPRVHGGWLVLIRRVSLRSMAKSIVALAAASCLAVLAAGGTYALLNSSAPVGSGATITAGTAALTLSPLNLSTTKLHPGLTIYGAVTVSNGGHVPLSTRIVGLTAPTASTAFSQSLSIGVGVATSAAACQGGSVASTWTGKFASNTPEAPGARPTLPVGGSVILCVAVTLPIDAPIGAQGQSATSFGVKLDATQV